MMQCLLPSVAAFRRQPAFAAVQNAEQREQSNLFRWPGRVRGSQHFAGKTYDYFLEKQLFFSFFCTFLLFFLIKGTIAAN